MFLQEVESNRQDFGGGCLRHLSRHERWSLARENCARHEPSKVSIRTALIDTGMTNLLMTGE